MLSRQAKHTNKSQDNYVETATPTRLNDTSIQPSHLKQYIKKYMYITLPEPHSKPYQLSSINNPINS